MPGVVISPASTTIPVVIRVSQATREFGSIVNAASSTASEIWSAILSGWPSVTDSEVNRYSMLSSCVTQITLLARRSVPTMSLDVPGRCVHGTGFREGEPLQQAEYGGPREVLLTSRPASSWRHRRGGGGNPEAGL